MLTVNQNRTNAFDLLQDKDLQLNSFSRTKACRYTNIGCKNNKCGFAHSAEEIKPRICPFKENCRKKNECQDYHPGDTIPPATVLWEKSLKKVNPTPVNKVKNRKIKLLEELESNFLNDKHKDINNIKSDEPSDNKRNDSSQCSENNVDNKTENFDSISNDQLTVCSPTEFVNENSDLTKIKADEESNEMKFPFYRPPLMIPVPYGRDPFVKIEFNVTYSSLPQILTYLSNIGVKAKVNSVN